MKILIPDGYDEPKLEREIAGPGFEFDVHHFSQELALPDSVWGTCDAIITFFEFPFDEALFNKLERCKIVVRAGIGWDHIDIEAAARRRIPVCTTPHYATGEVADHTMALLLSLLRGIPTYQEQMRNRPEEFRPSAAPLLRRISGLTLGLLGYGAIGRAVAERASAFGMRVLAHDPTFSHADDCAAPVSLEELLRGSDVLSLHCPLTPSTEGAIDAPALQQMKPSSILINTARGPIVDLDALHEALRTETIGGAALDVFSIEPPPNHPLLAAWRAGEEWIDGRLVLSPHAAYYSPEAVDGLRREATEAAVRFLTEGTLRHCVNKQLLPQ